MAEVAASIGPRLDRFTQLTQLKLGTNMALLPYLGGMQRLQELTINPAYRLTAEQIPCLTALRGLRRLQCIGKAADEAEHCKRLEVSLACCVVG